MAKIEEDISKLPPLGRRLLWVDNPKNVMRVVYGLYIVCAALFLADFFYKKKSYLPIEDVPGFYAIYGFIMCALLVICAKAMRIFVKRDENYYAPKDVESEMHPEHDLERIDADG